MKSWLNRLFPAIVVMALPAAAWAAGKVTEAACCGCCTFCCH